MFFFKRKKSVQNEEAQKKVEFDSSNLPQLIKYVKKYSGVDLSSKTDVLTRRFTTFCKQRDIDSFDELLVMIEKDASLRQKFMNLLTVNETYFLREEIQLFSAVELLKEGKKRVLSAPCASGEEVFSLAFLAHEAGVSEFDIVGIDLSSKAIDKANESTYSSRSLHKFQKEQVLKYFEALGENYRVKPKYQRGIKFKVCNVFSEEFQNLGEFDAILSRNMMIYFNEKYKLKTIEVFHKLLKPQGRLYVGHADLIPQNQLYKKITKDRLTYYEKI